MFGRVKALEERIKDLEEALGAKRQKNRTYSLYVEPWWETKLDYDKVPWALLARDVAVLFRKYNRLLDFLKLEEHRVDTKPEVPAHTILKRVRTK